MMKLAINILLVALLLAIPSATVYASGGHDTPAGEASDSHGETPLTTLFISFGAGLALVFVSGFTFGKEFKALSNLIILMIGTTGALHLLLGLGGDYLLLLNGVGYFGLFALRFILISETNMLKLVDIGLILYTIATIGGYFVLHTTSDTVGLVTKAFEVALIGLLVMDLTRLNNVDDNQAALSGTSVANPS